MEEPEVVRLRVDVAVEGRDREPCRCDRAIARELAWCVPCAAQSDTACSTTEEASPTVVTVAPDCLAARHSAV